MVYMKPTAMTQSLEQQLESELHLPWIAGAENLRRSRREYGQNRPWCSKVDVSNNVERFAAELQRGVMRKSKCLEQ